MAFDAFLKIQTIKGDSNDTKFADWIQIESFSWGEERPSSGTGVAIPLELQLVTTMQSSSPSLFEACATGVNLGTVQLHLRRASETQAVFLKWDLDNAVIGSYRAGGSAADDVPADQFSIAFTALTYAFTPQDEKGGSGATIVKVIKFA